MKKTSFKNLKIIASIALSLVMVLGFATTAFAADEDIPETGVKYTLTYPDGEVVTENSSGEALSYDDVMEALDETNWKLIGSGYKSDANGKVNLPAEWNSGTIKIVETEVPAGYRMGDVSEQTLELSAGSAEFVNPKIPEEDTPDVASYAITYNLNGGEYKGSTEDIVEVHAEGEVISIHEAPTREGYKFDYWKGSEYQPGDEYTVKGDHKFTAQWIAESTPATPEDPSEPKAPEEPAAPEKTTTPEKITTTAKKGSPETGDSNKAAAWAVVLLASVLSLTIIKRRREESCNADGSTNAVRLNGILLAVIALATVMVLANVVYAADGFVINKIDDNGDPVEGAVFDIYGKPEVTWEEITKPEGKVEIRIQKVWDDGDNQDGIRPDEVKVNITADGEDLTQAVVKNSDDWYYELGDLPRYDSTGNEIAYRWEEEPVNGYTVASYDSNTHYDGNDKFIELTITNAHTPETVTVSGRKTWTSSTGNNDDLDTSKIPEKYKVKLEKSTDGTNWTTVTTQEVVSYMAPPPTSPTDPTLPVDEWTFSDLPAKESGADIQYRVVEDPVPTGFTMTGGTKDANGKYNLTNTYTPTTGINLNVNFTQFYSNLSWIAKTVPVTTEELAQRTIRVGDQDIEVYKYTYSNPDATIYYGDMPYNSSVSQWYDANGNELDSADAGTAALIEALKNNAVLVKEEVTRDVFGGLFKDNVTKNITVTGPNGFSKSYSIKLGENSTYQIPITDAGEYTITQDLVESGDINNEAFAERNTGYTGIYSIQTAVVNVTKDGDNFSCVMNESKTMIYEHTVISYPKPYTLVSYDGENPYAESNGWHQGGGTSAAGDTVTINHYMDGVSEI